MSIIGNGIFLFGSRYIGGSSSLNPDTLTFGTGELGEVIYDTDQEWTCGEDTGLIVKDFETLTINEGVTVKAGTRNRGMIVRVLGDCNIYGTLCNNMAPKTLTNVDSLDWTLYPQVVKSATAGDGGDGGKGGQFSGGNEGGSGGAGMPGRFYGGGYGAGGGGGGSADSNEDSADDNYTGFNGGDATEINTMISNIFVGGTSTKPAGSYGGGGCGGDWEKTNGNDGPGVAGTDSHGGGSGGNGNYGGGVIILMVGGSLTLGEKASINCDGCNGGAGGGGIGNYQSFNGGGGGGGGGGIIYICYYNYISNHGNISCNGGAGGEVYSSSNGNPGSAGKAGPAAMIVSYEESEYS